MEPEAQIKPLKFPDQQIYSESDPKTVDANTVDDYFALSKKERTRFGFWYKKPTSLPSTFFGSDERGSWEEWERKIKDEFPVQAWVREWFWSLDNPVYNFIWTGVKRIKEIWYKICCYFNPRHDKIRKAIPRRWADICSLIVDVNFAMILDFYHGEAKNGFVDWSASEEGQKFYSWLEGAVEYIEKERPKLLEEISGSYPKSYTWDRTKSYQELYGEVDRREADLSRRDTDLIKQMVDYRDYFWT